MGRKNIACLMRRSRPPGSGYYAKAALASLFSLRCCSLAWRRRRSLRARSQSQAILDQQPCSRRDHRASPSIRGRTSTDAARGGISCSIVRRRFQALCGISGCLFRTRARHSPAIEYRRGKITVTDRKGLEECACECYAAIRERIDEAGNAPSAYGRRLLLSSKSASRANCGQGKAYGR